MLAGRTRTGAVAVALVGHDWEESVGFALTETQTL